LYSPYLSMYLDIYVNLDIFVFDTLHNTHFEPIRPTLISNYMKILIIFTNTTWSSFIISTQYPIINNTNAYKLLSFIFIHNSMYLCNVFLIVRYSSKILHCCLILDKTHNHSVVKLRLIVCLRLWGNQGNICPFFYFKV
jgi:hypothetical protein